MEDLQVFKTRRNYVTFLLNKTRRILSLWRSERRRSFKLLSEGHISAIIKKSAKKSCNLDPMLTQLVVDCLDQFLQT